MHRGVIERVVIVHVVDQPGRQNQRVRVHTCVYVFVYGSHAASLALPPPSIS